MHHRPPPPPSPRHQHHHQDSNCVLERWSAALSAQGCFVARLGAASRSALEGSDTPQHLWETTGLFSLVVPQGIQARASAPTLLRVKTRMKYAFTGLGRYTITADAFMLNAWSTESTEFERQPLMTPSCLFAFSRCTPTLGRVFRQEVRNRVRGGDRIPRREVAASSASSFSGFRNLALCPCGPCGSMRRPLTDGAWDAQIVQSSKDSTGSHCVR